MTYSRKMLRIFRDAVLSLRFAREKLGGLQR